MNKTLLIIGGLMIMPCVANGEKTLPAPLMAQVKAITDVQYTWKTQCHVRDEKPTIKVRACADQFESASMLLFCARGMDNVMLAAGPLVGESHTIPAQVRLQGQWQPTIDIRWVKRWWQSGRYIYENDHDIFISELLLHDDGLIQSSPDVPLRNEYPDRPQDSDTLQPTIIPDHPFGYTKQVWFTVYVPEGTPPGTYWSTVTVTSDQTPPAQVALKLYVWPFKLQKPRVDYSIYYRGQLVPEGAEPSISSEGKTADQMRNDLRNMVRHGVVNPNTYQGPGQKFVRMLGLRKIAGCDNHTLFSLGCGVGAQALDLQELQSAYDFRPDMFSTSRAWAKFYRKWGVQELYRVGKDEGSIEAIQKQIPLWRAAREGGCKIFVTANFEGYEQHIITNEGSELDMVVHSAANGFPSRQFVANLHKYGIKVYLYGNPQCGSEQPDIHRRSQGVMTMACDADGSMNYAWQAPFGAGHIWDDFAVRMPGNSIWRSHMMTYPTVNSCVDTLQWEGYSAGINDARFLTSLEQAIYEHGGELAKEACTWLEEVYEDAVTVDLDAMRQRCSEWIIRLMKD